MRGSIVFTAFGVLRTALALQHLQHTAPRCQPMRMAVDGGPGPRGRMPPATPDATQPLEMTRRTALATAGICACGCGVYLATSEDETWLDAAQIKLNDAAKARDERFARVMSCVEIKLSRRVSNHGLYAIDATSTQVMSGGMRDYEGWEEVRAFKTELFSHVQKNDDVVEIGIGSAPNLQYYGSKAKRVRAVEPNAAFFDLAATQAQWEDTTLDVVQGVAEAMPFEDNSVDVVVGTMVLCSVTSVRKACEEVKRVLKPGGRYLFTEHTRAPEDWRLLNAAQTVMDPLQNALANGCHLRRDPRPVIERVFGRDRVDARSFVLSNTQRGPPWPPHFLLAPHLVGVARV